MGRNAVTGEVTEKGPPTKCTDEFIERVVGCIKGGMSKTAAFHLGGVHPDTAYAWLRAVKKGAPNVDPQWVKLHEALELAFAEHEEELVGTIRQTATSGRQNTWQAAAWLLERRNPEEWGRKDKVEVSGNEEAPLIQLNQVVLNDPGARELGRDLLRRVAGAAPRLALGPGAGGEPAEESG